MPCGCSEVRAHTLDRVQCQKAERPLMHQLNSMMVLIQAQKQAHRVSVCICSPRAMVFIYPVLDCCCWLYVERLPLAPSLPSTTYSALCAVLCVTTGTLCCSTVHHDSHRKPLSSLWHRSVLLSTSKHTPAAHLSSFQVGNEVRDHPLHSLAL